MTGVPGLLSQERPEPRRQRLAGRPVPRGVPVRIEGVAELAPALRGDELIVGGHPRDPQPPEPLLEELAVAAEALSPVVDHHRQEGGPGLARELPGLLEVA